MVNLNTRNSHYILLSLSPCSVDILSPDFNSASDLASPTGTSVSVNKVEIYTR